jgi:hypothetical protein
VARAFARTFESYGQSAALATVKAGHLKIACAQMSVIARDLLDHSRFNHDPALIADGREKDNETIVIAQFAFNCP